MARRAPLSKSKPCPSGSARLPSGPVPWVGAQEWVVRDNFGERWRLRVVRALDAIPPPAEDSNSYRYPISRLVYGAFDQFGARGEGDVARGLLEAYDELTGASLSARVTNLASDRQRLLSHFNEHLEDSLHREARTGRLVVEHVEPLPWPFLGPLEPQPAPDPVLPVDEDLAFVAFRLVDQNGQPVPRRAVRLVLADQSEQDGFVDGEGRFRLDGVAPGNCKLTFPDLDLSDLSAPRVLPGQDEDEESGPVQVEPPPSGFAYTAEVSDTLSSIAERYGFLHFATIWNHSGNAALRAVRSDPHVLLLGDGIVVPPKNPPTRSIPTGAERTYIVFTQALRLKLRTVDATGNPVTVDDSSFHVDGSEVAATVAGGNIDLPISRDAREVTFNVSPKGSPEDSDVSPDDSDACSVNVGALPPLRESGGVEARLENLGYGIFGDGADIDSDDQEAVDPDVSERRALAVELFQEAAGQSPTGDETNEVLNQLRDRAGA